MVSLSDSSKRLFLVQTELISLMKRWREGRVGYSGLGEGVIGIFSFPFITRVLSLSF